MLEKYRSDYDGEFVLTKTTIRDGKKEQTREWIDNPIVNQHISGRAAIIGSSLDSTLFDYKILQNHRGGLMGSKRLQTYGSGQIWKDMRLDFYVSTKATEIIEAHNANYGETTVLYTNTGNVLKDPSKYYVVPFQPVMDDLALAVYLAAFDGHNEVFLIGYNKDTPGDNNWVGDVRRVMSDFKDVTFYLVGVEVNMPDVWRNMPNVKCINYRKFITYCDI